MDSAPKYYPDVDANPDFPKIEEKVLSAWKSGHIFEASVAARGAQQGGANNEFIFYDGPPFANGLPHYGHLLTGFVKDLFARYQTMRGRRVERRFGWDCHGLPAEMGAEKELGISGRQAIISYGIGKFNDYCRTSVMKYTKEWEHYVTRQARWVDFRNDYQTMDKNYMESVLWAFKQLYDKGLVYEAHRVMPYSWAAETPLSNFETKLDNSYRERVDKAITVAFELNEKPKGAPDAEKYYMLAWTTTPWTLPSNLALAVNVDTYYEAVIVRQDTPYFKKGDCVILSENKFGYYAKELGLEDGRDLSKELLNPNVPPIKGSLLVGLTYKPLFPYFKEHPNSFRILDGSDFVTDSDGTGIVHMAPGFGEDDQRVCEANGIELIVPVDGSGRFTDEIYDLYDDRPCPALPQAGGGFSTGSTKESLAAALTSPSPRLRGDTGGPAFGKGPNTTRNPEAMQNAQALRKNPTEAEKKLWGALSGNKLEGFKFRRQQSIGQFIVDFVCMERQLVVELDGSQHAAEQEYDADRTAFLNDAGFRVLRFWNNEVLENLEGVVESILSELAFPPVSPRKRGEGEVSARGEGDKPVLRLRGMNVLEENLEHYKFGEANERIIEWLKKHGQLIRQEQITHNYPHCWRTDKPLIYRAMPSWYVEVTKFRDRAVELNQQINWIPAHIRDGQMGHMLATAPDWSISRNRFWGTPIPVWKSPSGKIKVFGSIAELEAASGQKVTDLHRPFIDEIIIKENGEEFRRVDDVFDCWFESGSMPFAQVHYPFENREWFEHHFPADFITEYVGQTRGWFNTLIMLSTALFDKPPFKNCICHGVVLDSETGNKYSKRLKNYKDPTQVMDKFGADALRWLMISSPVMRGLDLAVDPEGKFIRDVVRLAIKPIWNAYNFFCLYANADGIKAEFSMHSQDIMDRYILAKCREAVESVATALDGYDTPAATEAVTKFFDALNNWYIRRSKERFWKSRKDADKQAAYNTLYTVLATMCRAAAPLLPLTLEEIYQGLTGEKSVHLTDYPSLRAEGEAIEPGSRGYDGLTALMDMTRDICNAAHAVRNRVNIRVRQPLAQMRIIGDAAGNLAFTPELKYIVADEVNVKEVVGQESKKITDFANYRLQIHFPVLGKRLPDKIKQIIPASKKGDWEQLKDGRVKIAGEVLEENEFTILLEPKPEYKDRAQALSTNDALVILDTEITPELEAEGYARDLVRLIQQARKEAGLHISDRIHLRLRVSGALKEALHTHMETIAAQVLAVSLTEGDMQGCTYIVNETIEDEEVSIGFAPKAVAA